jgi:hypothetical protein
MITITYEKRFGEGFSWNVILILALFFSLIVFLMIESLFLISAIMNGANIQELIISASLFYLFILPISFISILINALVHQKSYLFYKDHLTILTSRTMPIFGRAFFIKDIKKIEYSGKISLFYMFDRDLRVHRNNITLPFYVNDVYIIELREGHKIIQHGKTVPPPVPRNFIEGFFYRGWFNKYVIVPKHIIERYISLGYDFPTHLLRNPIKR